jgi:hypothetical protein
VDVAGQHLLADAAFAGDQDRGVRARHAVGHGDHRLHGDVARHHRAVVVGDRGQDGGDQLGVRRQGDELLGPGADGVGRLARAGVDAAGHHRHPDALGLVGGDQAGDVEQVVDHQQVGALAGAQGVGRRRRGLDVRHLGARAHRHLHGERELPVQSSDDKKPHDFNPLRL